MSSSGCWGHTSSHISPSPPPPLTSVACASLSASTIVGSCPPPLHGFSSFFSPSPLLMSMHIYIAYLALPLPPLLSPLIQFSGVRKEGRPRQQHSQHHICTAGFIFLHLPFIFMFHGPFSAARRLQYEGDLSPCGCSPAVNGYSAAGLLTIGDTFRRQS